MAKLKVAIIGCEGLPANYGGFETLAQNLVEQIAGDYQFEVFCTSRGREDRLKFYQSAKLTYLPIKANGLQSILYDVISMVFAAPRSNVLLILGVSGCIFLPLLKYFTGAKIVVNIDGVEWKRDKWNRIAKWFLKKSEGVAVRHADVVITDNVAIQDYVLAEYGRDSEFVAYGGDHAIVRGGRIFSEENCAIDDERYAISVCRIEPENKVHIILNAFSKASSIPLVMVGNWAASQYGRSLKNRYKSHEKITLHDPIYEVGELFKLRNEASVYIHGHSAGGTNPSLVEAMHFGLPIIAFDVKYNRCTTFSKALYFKSEEELIQIISKLESSVLKVIAAGMLRIARDEYTWHRIGKEYSRIINEVCKT